MSGEYAVSLEGVSLTYPSASRPSLRDIELTVAPGELVAIIGPSGCGKTSVTRVVNGLAEKYYEGALEGSVRVGGLDVRRAHLHEIGKTVGSVFQDPRSQFFASLVEDEVAFGMENYGVPHRLLDERVDTSLAQVRAKGLKGREVFPLSSGEKQKVAIASVSAVDPLAYVFDEPSANLDMKSVDALGSLMVDLKRHGRALVVAEHRVYYLTDIADRFIYMEHGEIVRVFSRSDLLTLTVGERERMGIRSPSIDLEESVSQRCFRGEEAGVEISRLSYTVRSRRVFDDLDLRIPCGNLVALVGRNGVGKTTLARVICGLAKGQGGAISFSEEPVGKRERRRASYFVSQNADCQLFSDSVAEELLLNRPELSSAEIEALLDAYGLLAFKESHPMILSGGQKQRLAIAIAELVDASVILLDEPTSGLDYRNMRRISLRLKMLAAGGKTVLVISHDYEFIASSCAAAIHIGGPDSVTYLDMADSKEELLAALME